MHSLLENNKQKIKTMKNLKLLFLTLFSVISLTLFSQNQLYVTNATGPNDCNGTATLNTTNVDTTSIFWQGMGAILNQGSSFVTNLCPGTYSVTFISNGTTLTLPFNILIDPCVGFNGAVTTVDATNEITCDGTMSVTTINGGTGPYTYLWSNGSTTQTISTLCVGYYSCNITDVNGCTITLNDSVGYLLPNYGDTLVINGNNCQFPQDTIFTQLEDCTFNFNSIDSAFLSYVDIPTNPTGNMVLNWEFIDTTGGATYLQTYAPNVDVDGCYEFTLTLFCSQKSLNIKTIIVNDARALFLVGIDEVTQTGKTLVKVIDMMGRETIPTTNKPLIYVYSDGSKEKRYISE